MSPQDYPNVLEPDKWLNATSSLDYFLFFLLLRLRPRHTQQALIALAKWIVQRYSIHINCQNCMTTRVPFVAPNLCGEKKVSETQKVTD